MEGFCLPNWIGKKQARVLDGDCSVISQKLKIRNPKQELTGNGITLVFSI